MAAEKLNEEEMTLLAGADQTPVGRAFLHAARIMEARAERGLDDPKVNTERVADDLRYRLGERRGTGWVSRVVRAAQRERGIVNED